MGAGLGLIDARRFAAERGGQRSSTTCGGDLERLFWRCSKGDRWQAQHRHLHDSSSGARSAGPSSARRGTGVGHDQVDLGATQILEAAARIDLVGRQFEALARVDAELRVDSSTAGGSPRR